MVSDGWYEYPKGSKDTAVDPFKIREPGNDAALGVRGGAWWADSGMCKSRWRGLNPPTPNGFRGFRIVLGPEIRDVRDKNGAHDRAHS